MGEFDKIFFLDETNDVINKINEDFKKKNNKKFDEPTPEDYTLGYQNIMKELKNNNSNYIANKINDFHKNSFKKHIDIIKVFEETWGSAFTYYDFFIENYINLSTSLRNYLVQYIIDEKYYNYTFKVLIYLNGQAIQIMNGILVSLRSGYPDDAYTRTRKLYEILIIFNVIIKYGDEMAINYMESDGRNYNWAKPHIKPFDKNKNNRNKNKNIRNKNRRLDLTDLEINCGLDEKIIENWKEEQKYMHKIVHVTPQSTFARMDEIIKDNIKIGPTHSEIDFVAINTIKLMKLIFNSYLSFVNSENDVYISILKEQYLYLLEQISQKMENEFDELYEMHFEKNDDSTKN